MMARCGCGALITDEETMCADCGDRSYHEWRDKNGKRKN